MTSIIRPALNLNHKHFDRTIRGIRCIGSWYFDQENGGQYEQCLVLTDAQRMISSQRIVPIIILLNDAHKFAVSDDGEVGDKFHAQSSITEWILEGHLPNDVIGIMTAINDCLRDLYNMPPIPDEGQFAIGDVIIKDPLSGKTIDEKEIKNDVQH